MYLIMGPQDWYVAYKNHHIACRDFPIVVVDMGHAAVKYEIHDRFFDRSLTATCRALDCLSSRAVCVNSVVRALWSV